MRNRVRSKAMRTEESGFCVDCRVDRPPETRRGISATGFIYLPLCCGCVAAAAASDGMGWDELWYCSVVGWKWGLVRLVGQGYLCNYYSVISGLRGGIY